jgi:hypothetical protein
MTARNLGVVFGRKYRIVCLVLSQNIEIIRCAATLMRSPDPAAEFSDMAGKALSIEWLVEHASTIFSPTLPPS